MAYNPLEIILSYIPKYLWEHINYPEGHIVSHEDFNEKWNLNVTQGDYHALVIRAIIDLLTGEVDINLDLSIDSIKDVKFYNNGFVLTTQDDEIKIWTYTVDELGHITLLTNAAENRQITMDWFNTEL